MRRLRRRKPLFKTIVLSEKSIQSVSVILFFLATAFAFAAIFFQPQAIGEDLRQQIYTASIQHTIPSIEGGNLKAVQTRLTNLITEILGFQPFDPASILQNQFSAFQVAAAMPENNSQQPAAQQQNVAPSPTPAPQMDENDLPIAETSLIVGGVQNESGANKSIYMDNHTSYDVDIQSLLDEPLNIASTPGEPFVLIVHTHTTESYTPSGQSFYSPEDSTRTQDPAYNVVRVGEELAAQLQAAGIQVIHDKSINDYPSYNGSYKKTLGVIDSYLEKYPSIQIVIDVHRDGMTKQDGTKLKLHADINGESSAQVMLVMGTDEGGLDHPDWRENLKLGLRIQDAMTADYPGLARPLGLQKERYNQHATRGSMILEVGTDGNTLEEAITAAKYTGMAMARVIKQL